jgi:hypothetical protein
MLSLLLTLLVAAQQAPVATRSGTIFATIAHSEWCPAGNVQLNLRKGEFRHTPRAARRVCHDRGIERVSRSGRLSAAQLAAVRSAFDRVRTEGMVDPPCHAGRGQRPLVISNGGTPVLALTDNLRTMSAPDELGCWSGAANAMHALLDQTFQQPR